jgi:hypothetical protein
MRVPVRNTLANADAFVGSWGNLEEYRALRLVSAARIFREQISA